MVKRTLSRPLLSAFLFQSDIEVESNCERTLRDAYTNWRPSNYIPGHICTARDKCKLLLAAYLVNVQICHVKMHQTGFNFSEFVLLLIMLWKKNSHDKSTFNFSYVVRQSFFRCYRKRFLMSKQQSGIKFYRAKRSEEFLLSLLLLFQCTHSTLPFVIIHSINKSSSIITVIFITIVIIIIIIIITIIIQNKILYSLKIQVYKMKT